MEEDTLFKEDDFGKNALVEIKRSFLSVRSKDKWFLIIAIVCLIVIVVSLFAMYISGKVYDNNVRKKYAFFKEQDSLEAEQQAKEEEERLRREAKRKKHIPQEIPNAPDVVAAIYDSDEKQAFITFDDGPSEITKEVLDVLKEEDVKATFFVLGKMVDTNPDILKREKEEGHYIANHSYTHDYSSIYSTPQATLDEYNRCEAAIKNVIGDDYNTYLFRFPGGSSGGKTHSKKQEAKKLFHEKNIATTNWNCLTGDAAGNNTVELQLEEFNNTRAGKNSLIILMHDAPDKKLTPETLRNVIHILKSEGYVFRNFYDVFKSEE